MDRSSGFGSTPCYSTPLSDSLSLRLPYSVKLATQRKSLTHYTKGTPSPCLISPRRANQAGCQHCATRNAVTTQLTRASYAPKPRRCLRLNTIHFPLDSFVVSRACALGRQRTTRVKTNEAGLRLFVCMRFQDLFHSPPGVLFAFPSRYWFTIGRCRVFSLGGWSPHLQTGFHVSRPTCRNFSTTIVFSRTGLSPTTAGLSRPFH